ncbi:uncharacterized protein LOC119979787 [Tripterygium wilfordii]|uniref:uncharacterized protein LOC119979787 n=1 Tax=Tripterygium wilfordii TaxID=458696 RepID=UPI0018F862FC|nr:uncharacterized protein LOC119979787 [Tripterygium wilfordii]
MKKEKLNVWKITVIKGQHTCTNASLHQGHRQLDSEYIAEEVLPMVRADLKINIVAIQAFASSQLQLLQAIQVANPGSVVNFNYKDIVSNRATFGRVFWAFWPCIVGFQSSRPLISIDGTHLYGKYKGKLLIAVGFDADNGLFLLCFVIVDEESADNWGWFIACIRSYVTDRRGICVLSDRHAGILAAMRDGWPEPFAYHRYCSRHFVSNFNTHFKDKDLKQAVVTMANEESKNKFDFWMSCGKDLNIVAWEHLNSARKEKWSKAYDDGHIYGNMTTNMSEIFNSVLKGGRFLPITTLVHLTFYRCNKYFVKRRIEAEEFRLRGIDLPPQVFGHISCETAKSKREQVRMFNHNPPTFECCSANRIDWSIYMEPYFTIGAYESTYAPVFSPIPDETCWPDYLGPMVVVDDAQRRKREGRPKSTRLRNDMDAREGRTTNKFKELTDGVDRGGGSSSHARVAGVRITRESRPSSDNQSVLHMQSNHRLEDIWRGQDTGEPIRFGQHMFWPLDPRVRPYVIQAGFYGITQIGNINLIMDY